MPQPVAAVKYQILVQIMRYFFHFSTFRNKYTFLNQIENSGSSSKIKFKYQIQNQAQRSSSKINFINYKFNKSSADGQGESM